MINTEIKSQEILVEFLNEYADRLIGYINSYIHNVWTAEDIMMDIFVNVIKLQITFNTEQECKSYLFKSAKNRAYTHLKQSKRRDNLTEGLIKENIDFEEMFYKSERNKIILDALKKLKKTYREVIYLSFFEDMKLEEIANILSMDIRQVRNIKHRAKNKLAKLLKENSFILDKEVNSEK